MSLRGLARRIMGSETARAAARGSCRARVRCVEVLEARRLLTIDAAALANSPIAVATYLPPQHSLFQYGGYLTEISAAAPLQVALNYMRSHAGQLGALPGDFDHFAVTKNYVTPSTGATSLTLVQTYEGLEVEGARFNVTVSAQGQLLMVAGGFVPGLSAWAQPLVAAPGVGAWGAIHAAARDLGVGEAVPQLVDGNGLPPSGTWAVPAVSQDAISPRLHYVSRPGNQVSLAWDVTLRTPNGSHWYNTSVDAQSGELVSLVDYIDHESYEVFAQPARNPNDAPRTVENNPYLITPAPALVPSPFGWHDTNGVAGPEYQFTRGNNVSAYADRNNDDIPDEASQPVAGPGLDFTGALVSFNPALSPLQNQHAAVANLFYWNNILHDVHYLYGFDEASGNFQVNNYGRGGEGSDAVRAEAQDGGGLNNAFFGTPPDGLAAQMTMYEYNDTSPRRDSAFDAEIIIHEYGHGVSNRLTGNGSGLFTIQSGGMGEGWSDWWALMLTQKSASETTAGRGMATYATGDPLTARGIRNYRYDFDISNTNLETFLNFGTGIEQQTESHAAGTRWASILWDINHLLMQKYGFNPNVYESNSGAGNIRALHLVMNALKIQPANPTFIQARDAILMSDQLLYGGAHQFEIWTAFARRGLGQFASTSDSSSSVLTTSFVVPLGLLPMLVDSSSPAAGSTVNTPPTDFVIHLSQPYAAASVDAADLKVNGTPAISVLLTDANTLTFHYNVSPVVGQGLQTMEIEGGAILRHFDQQAGLEFESSFFLDLLPLTVLSTTPPSAGGGLTVPGPVTVDLNFNEPVDPASVQLSDMALSGIAGATVAGVELLSGNTVLQVTLEMPAVQGTLQLSLAAGSIADAFGNGGQAFAAAYYVDTGTTGFLLPLTPRRPHGSLIYDTAVTGAIQFAGDADSFEISLDGHQTLSVLVEPNASLAPAVEVRDPEGGLLATESTAAGSNLLLQTVSAMVAGTYTVTLKGQGASVGQFAATLVLNGAIETEGNVPGVINDTRATAQNLDDSFISLLSGEPLSPTRAAVVANGSLADDVFSFSLAAGDIVTLAVDGAGVQGAQLTLLDASGVPLAAGGELTGMSRIISDYPIPMSGTYYARLSDTSPGAYQLVVTRGAAFDTEANNSVQSAQALSAAPPVGRRFVLGAIDDDLPPQADVDVFRIHATAGQQLQLFTATPGGGSGGPVNTLDPRLRLLDSNGQPLVTDDNGGGDGRNASITYLVVVEGDYFVELSGVNSSLGEYLLSANGITALASSFQVVAVDPPNGAGLETSPMSVEVDFGAGIYLPSVGAADLLIDGLAVATAVEIIDGNTLAFTLAGPLADGAHTLAISAGAILSTDLVPLAAFQSQFVLDQTGPRVISTSLAAGATVPPGASLTYQVTFDEPIGSADVSTDDLMLVGVHRGGSFVPANLELDPSGTILSIRYDGLPEDRYTLTLFAGGDHFADLLGNPLNGEFSGTFPSGNASPGGDFSIDFSIDVDPDAVSLPLTAIAPLGSLIYESSAQRVIAFAGDTDGFTLDVDAGQSVSVLVEASGELAPLIELRSPSGALLGTAVGTAVGTTGSVALLESTPALAGGNYQIVVRGSGGSQGIYLVRVVLNASLEVEARLPGSDNNTLATAEDLDPSFVASGTPGTPTRRGAVRGMTDAIDHVGNLPEEVESNNTRALANDASANFEYHASGLFQLGVKGTIGSASDVDYYAIGHLHVGDVITVAMSGVASSRGSLPNPLVALFMGPGATTQVTYDDQGGPGSDALLHRIVITVEADYFIAAYGASNTTGTYDLASWLETGVAGQPTIGGNVTSEVESNNNGPTATNISTSWRLAPYVSHTTGQLLPAGESDYFAYALHAGDLVSVYVASTSTLNAQVRLRRTTGTVIAAENGESLPQDSGIYAFTIPTDGTYYVEVLGTAGFGTYEAKVYLASSFPPLGLAPASDFYSLNLAAGESSTVVITPELSGQLTLELQNSAGVTVATSVGGATNVGRSLTYVAAVQGTYYVRVSGAPNIAYSLVVVREGVFDLEANNSTSSAQSLGPAGAAIGYVATGSEDWYFVDIVEPAAPLTIRTTTPADFGGQFVNLGNPRIELYDPSGVLLAQGITVGDGRNEVISLAQVPTAGAYRIRVVGEQGGEYFLNVRLGADLAPIVDLNGEAIGMDYSNPAKYQVHGAGARIAHKHASIVDDGGLLSSMTISLVDPRAGDILEADTLGTSILATFNGGTLTLSGNDSVANYRDVLRSVLYSNSNYNGPSGVSSRTVVVVASDGNSQSPAAMATVGIASAVASRLVFYNNSKFDGNGNNGGAVSASDDLAIASDKIAYLATGGAATFASVTGYNKGLNGIMIDLSGPYAGTLSTDDFIFRVSGAGALANNAPDAWAAAPLPTISLRVGAGLHGSDRVELVWPDGAIVDCWLQVIVKSNTATGLRDMAGGSASGIGDVFYFGNLRGNASSGDSPAFAIVSSSDQLAVRGHTGPFASLGNQFDFNRDRIVNATDELIARAHQGILRMVNLTAVPVAFSASAVSDVGEPPVATLASQVVVPLPIAPNRPAPSYDTQGNAWLHTIDAALWQRAWDGQRVPSGLSDARLASHVERAEVRLAPTLTRVAGVAITELAQRRAPAKAGQASRGATDLALLNLLADELTDQGDGG